MVLRPNQIRDGKKNNSEKIIYLEKKQIMSYSSIVIIENVIISKIYHTTTTTVASKGMTGNEEIIIGSAEMYSSNLFNEAQWLLLIMLTLRVYFFS